MGRIVWFGGSLLAAGAGAPAVPVIAVGAAVIGVVACAGYFFGRRKS